MKIARIKSESNVSNNGLARVSVTLCESMITMSLRRINYDFGTKAINNNTAASSDTLS